MGGGDGTIMIVDLCRCRMGIMEAVPAPGFLKWGGANGGKRKCWGQERTKKLRISVTFLFFSLQKLLGSKASDRVGQMPPCLS